MQKISLSSTPTAPGGTPAFPLPPPGGGGNNFGEGGGQQLSRPGYRSTSQLLASYAPGGKEHAAQLFLAEVGDSATSRLPTALLPRHPYLQRRLLASGLEVFVLPHAHPEGSLEVHLEVHAGSTAEADSERGMAHLCEHLVFMGNRKRGEVVALQGEANAFTDFHHTVYFVSWRGGERNGTEGRNARKGQEQQPTGRQDWSPRRLKAALEMMREVFTVFLADPVAYFPREHKCTLGTIIPSEGCNSLRLYVYRHFEPVLFFCAGALQAPTQFTSERLLKEKAAILSESSLVNTIFYRKEQAQLSKVHSDTILPSRFPIGDMELLRSWSVEEVRKFFARFYRPENATLYIVGDVAPLAALRYVDDIIGPVRGDKAGEEEWRVIRSRWLQRTVKKQ